MKTYALVFVSVFLAELGDKTQRDPDLRGHARGRSPRRVHRRPAGALVTSSLLAVLVGERLGAWIPPHYLTRAAGVPFVAIGLWLLVTRA